LTPPPRRKKFDHQSAWGAGFACLRAGSVGGHGAGQRRRVNHEGTWSYVGTYHLAARVTGRTQNGALTMLAGIDQTVSVSCIQCQVRFQLESDHVTPRTRLPRRTARGAELSLRPRSTRPPAERPAATAGRCARRLSPSPHPGDHRGGARARYSQSAGGHACCANHGLAPRGGGLRAPLAIRRCRCKMWRGCFAAWRCWSGRPGRRSAC
jgi:hypothetical protein